MTDMRMNPKIVIGIAFLIVGILIHIFQPSYSMADIQSSILFVSSAILITDWISELEKKEGLP